MPRLFTIVVRHVDGSKIKNEFWSKKLPKDDAKAISFTRNVCRYTLAGLNDHELSQHRLPLGRPYNPPPTEKEVIEEACKSMNISGATLIFKEIMEWFNSRKVRSWLSEEMRPVLKDRLDRLRKLCCCEEGTSIKERSESFMRSLERYGESEANTEEWDFSCKDTDGTNSLEENLSEFEHHGGSLGSATAYEEGPGSEGPVLERFLSTSSQMWPASEDEFAYGNGGLDFEQSEPAREDSFTQEDTCFSLSSLKI